MYYNLQWGSICSEGWDSVDTRVACSQLGFPETNSVTFNVSAKKTAAHQPVHSSNVQCDGTESSILTCSQDPIGSNTCDLSSIVVVMCDASNALGEGACIVNSDGTLDQISGFLWHETYLKLLEQPGFKGCSKCANRLISRVSNFNSPLSEFYIPFEKVSNRFHAL